MLTPPASECGGHLALRTQLAIAALAELTQRGATRTVLTETSSAGPHSIFNSNIGRRPLSPPSVVLMVATRASGAGAAQRRVEAREHTAPPPRERRPGRGADTEFAAHLFRAEHEYARDSGKRLRAQRSASAASSVGAEGAGGAAAQTAENDTATVAPPKKRRRADGAAAAAAAASTTVVTASSRPVENAYETLQRLRRYAGSTERFVEHVARLTGADAAADVAAGGKLDVAVTDLDTLHGTGAGADTTRDTSWRRRDELKRLRDGTYINCDLRYFNLAYLKARLGNFDVVLIDPPWRIAGSQRDATPTNTMLSNNAFALNYRTLSNQEILAVEVEALADRGLCFLWVVSSQIAAGLECLAKWGYEYIDKLTWVKKRRRKLHVSHGYHFLHSTELCLVGIKRPFEYIGKVTNDAIFADVREKSRKPDQLYRIIEAMAPGAQKVELFARNHNIRKDWLSLGNELGEQFMAWHNEVQCDTCGGYIQSGEKRFKSRSSANRDLCEACVHAAAAAGATSLTDWFEMAAAVSEPVYHEYFECDDCGVSPIWGTRFHGPGDEDLCEQCVDNRLAHCLPAVDGEASAHSHSGDASSAATSAAAADSNESPCATHSPPVRRALLADWVAFETPRAAGDLPVHRNVRCQACLQCPIIGYRFACVECQNMSLCQKCFFNSKRPRAHAAEHDVEIIVDPAAGEHKYIRCDGCRAMPIVGHRYRCDACYNFDLCETCYERGAAPASHPAHGAAHTFTRIVDS